MDCVLAFRNSKKGHLIVASAVQTFSHTLPHTSQGLRNTETLSVLDRSTLTYGLNINSIAACIRDLAVRVSVEALKVLRLLRVSGDPV